MRYISELFTCSLNQSKYVRIVQSERNNASLLLTGQIVIASLSAWTPYTNIHSTEHYTVHCSVHCAVHCAVHSTVYTEISISKKY